ncbi:MAG TPA: MFS transporter [Longimicrobiales bacterium]
MERARFALRALRHRNFRLFTIGQSISLIGNWMQQLAMGWLVYRLTNSAFLLGLVAFGAQGPTFILAPFAGVLADRSNRHRIVVATQVLMMVQATVLTVLVITGAVRFWHVLVLSAFFGAVSAFDIPARQAFLLQMVESREDLPNAIALNSSMFNGARLIGPAFAGLMIARFGEGIAFLSNAVSYLAVIAALLAMRIPPQARRHDAANLFSTLREGFRYAFDFAPIRDVLALVAVVALFGVPFTVLMPVFAVNVLHGDAKTLGLLMSATGLGALSGALYLAARENVRGLSRVITGAAIVFGASLAGFAISRSLGISLLLLVTAGFGMMVQMAASNTFLQTVVEDDKRGRIMSLYTMAYIGVAPIGSLLAGAAAERVGAPITIAVGGAVSILGAALFARQIPRFRELVRPIYRQLGIIPEVASGIQAATQLTTPPEEQ